jgi:hypothetical protein
MGCSSLSLVKQFHRQLGMELMNVHTPMGFYTALMGSFSAQKIATDSPWSRMEFR